MILHVSLLSDIVKSLPIKRNGLNNDADNIVEKLVAEAENVQLTETESQTESVEDNWFINNDLGMNDDGRNSNSNVGQGNSNARPGMFIQSSSINVAVNGDSFNGRIVMDVRVTGETRNKNLLFDVQGLIITSVQVGLISEANAGPAPFWMSFGNRLEVDPPTRSNSYVVVVEYMGNIRNDGQGFYRGGVADS